MRDEPCEFGCDDDACTPDPCVGRTCTTPPTDRCDDSDHLHVYDTVGSCSAGECTYASRALSCACADDACMTDPCPSVTCDQPPAAFCPSNTVRRSFAAIGTCSGGACSYEPTDAPCAFGCSNGSCNPDPCAGVQCTTPPNPSCPTSESLRTDQSPGTCLDGACSYEATVTICASDQHCTGGTCVDGEPPAVPDPVVPALTVECPVFQNSTITFMGLEASRSGRNESSGAHGPDGLLLARHGLHAVEYEALAATVPRRGGRGGRHPDLL